MVGSLPRRRHIRAVSDMTISVPILRGVITIPVARLKQLIPIRSRLSMPELLNFFKARTHMDRFAGCRDSG